MPAAATAQGETPVKATPERPNIVFLITDQQRADLCGREGYPLDVTPFADRCAKAGVWFNRAYTTTPASIPARTSLITGRWPKATRVNSNHNMNDAVYTDDLWGVARKQGYKTALVGKNHTYTTAEKVDLYLPYEHSGQGQNKNKGPEAEEFDKFLRSTHMYASFTPSPGGVEQQLPYRIVDDAVKFAEGNKDGRFVMEVSFPEPHNPYQCCEPYFSMFPEDKLPALKADVSYLDVKGTRYELLKEMMQMGHVGYFENLQKLRGIYLGMVRMVDDQMARMVDEFRKLGLYENTVFVILSDHGDYVGEYGLMKKGVGLDDVLCRIPMVWFGASVERQGLSGACVSLADLMPTFCEMMDADIPMGVQGRSLREMLAGRVYPADEFRSVMIEDGYGGQYYTARDGNDFQKEGAVGKNNFFDELNTWSQSGGRRALRMGDWKLQYDMEGNGWMCNVKDDPSEVKNLYGNPKYAAKQSELLAEMLKWEVATEDPLPIPRNRYRFKRYEHNYLFCAPESYKK